MKKNNYYSWDRYFKVNFVFDNKRDLVWKAVCRFFQKRYISKESRILDAGAGYCNFINNICGNEKYAIDVYDKFQDYANADVISYVKSCTQLDIFKDDYFDIIFASNLLEHLTTEDLAETLHEFNRILKSGGKLILLQPNFKYCFKTYFDDYTHKQIFTDRSLSELLKTYGMRVLDVKPRFLPVNMKTTLKFNLPKLDLVIRFYLNLPFKPLAKQMLIVTEKREHK